MLKSLNFPQIYLEMNRLGWLDAESRDYLWLNEMKWKSQTEVMNYKHEEGEIDSIIPFAVTGRGDKWVWKEESNRLLVALCFHDDYEGVIYAENLEGAIFRNILEYVSSAHFYTDEKKAESFQIDIEELRNYLVNWRKRFNRWFNDEWLYELDELEKLELKICETQYGSYFALLTPDEARSKTKKFLNFDRINEPFNWINK
ncbi:hypothetical protein ACQKNB_22800 [Lysinibacillus xylanilyticus]|uniref:hypothetical protein n=1 Tax=Lysinibacillus xylanilyticus TaxID=582475 RepID=UPI003CFFCA51